MLPQPHNVHTHVCIDTCNVFNYTELEYLRELLKEANDNGYNSSEVCDDLRLTIQEVEKCATTAVQIASGKLKTRGSGLDVEELRDFLKQVDMLPCKLPEANKLQVYSFTCTVCVCLCVFWVDILSEE